MFMEMNMLFYLPYLDLKRKHLLVYSHGDWMEDLKIISHLHSLIETLDAVESISEFGWNYT